MYPLFSFCTSRTKRVEDKGRLIERPRWGYFKGNDILIGLSSTATHLFLLALRFADPYVALGYKFSVYLIN